MPETHQFSGSIHGARNVLQGNISYSNITFNQAESHEITPDQCLSVLMVTDPVDDRKRLLNSQQRLPGTCEWIKRHEVYEKWASTHKNVADKLCWLNGPQGMGKTTMALYITEILEQRCGQAQGKATLLYYFCSRADQRRQTGVSILRGLIYSFCQQQPDLVRVLLKEYQVQGDRLFRETALDPLWRILDIMLRESRFETVYCVVDGIDECVMESLTHLLPKLRRYFARTEDQGIASSCSGEHVVHPFPNAKNSYAQGNPANGVTCKGSPLRMLLVGRPNLLYLGKMLAEFPNIDVRQSSPKGTVSDFDMLVDAIALDIAQNRSCGLTSSVIREKLVAASNGNLLWIELAGQRLRAAKLMEVKQTLADLPPSVLQIYCQMLEAIAPEHQNYCSWLLTLISLAMRPLAAIELQVALGLIVNTTIGEEHMTHLLFCCTGLLTLSNGAVSLAHDSVKDLLLGDGSPLRMEPGLRHFVINISDAHSMLSNVCTEYLVSGALNLKGATTFHTIRLESKGKIKLSTFETKWLQKWPLLSYAAMNWPQHARQGNVQHLNFNSNTLFFASISKVRDLWWQCYWISSGRKAASRLTIPSEFSLLHVAAYFGIVLLASHIECCGWLGHASKRRDSHANRPIDCAVERSQLAMVEYLIEHGSLSLPRDALDHCLLENTADNLLPAATVAGNAEILDLLLVHSRRIRSESQHSISRFRSFQSFGRMAGALTLRATRYPALMIAQAQERLGGADWRRAKYSYGASETHLHVAAAYGHDAAIDVLLANDMDVSAQTTGGWEPLHNAAWYGRPTIILKLVSKDADPNVATSQYGMTPLHCAVREGHTDCVGLLSDIGASVNAVNARDAKGKTALHIASKNLDKPDMIKTLLDCGADIEARYSKANITPLLYAAMHGKCEIVRCLLERGADVDAKYIDYNEKTWTTSELSCVEIAWRRKHNRVAEILTNHINDLHSTDRHRSSLRHSDHASQAGSGSIYTR